MKQKHLSQEEKEKLYKEKFDAYFNKVNPFITTEKPPSVSSFWPIHNFALCEPHIIKKKTSGIIIPDQLQKKQEGIMNDAIAFKVIKVGPECVNVKPGDYILQNQQSAPLMYPLIDDVTSSNPVDHEIREYKLFAENWIGGICREDAKPEDFKHSKWPEWSYKSTGVKKPEED